MSFTSRLPLGSFGLRVGSGVRYSSKTRMHTRGRGANFSTLVVAAHDNITLSPSTASAVTAARGFNKEVSVLVAGHSCESIVEAASKIEGVSRVLSADKESFKKTVADTLARLIARVAEERKYEVVVGPVCAQIRDTLPRLAGLLDVAPLSDASGIEDEGRVIVRPTYAGNALARVRWTDDSSLRVLSIRPTCFEPAPAERSEAAPIEKISDDTLKSLPSPLSEVVKEEKDVSDSPKLGTAKVVVSGGRALGSEKAFNDVLVPLAKKLKAAIGASRAAVDAGYCPNDMQVGQTGKIVAPDLYIAIGISGAIQHLAGMQDAKTIVAVNKDAEAPIFQIADVGVVGDLFSIVPELTDKL